MALLGLEAFGVETVGEIPRGLPSLTLPDLSLMAALWPGALGITLMSFTETMAVGRAFAQSGEPARRPNRELLATGIATAGGALLGGMSRAAARRRWPNRLAVRHSWRARMSGATLHLLFPRP
jgi:MFS superfamily sulfate permease-like transporter